MNGSSSSFDQGKIQVVIALVTTGFIVSAWLLLPQPFLPLMMALAILGGIATVCTPLFICLGFLVLSLYRIHEVFPLINAARPVFLLGLLTCATLTWHVLIARTIRPFMSPELKTFILFFLIVTAGIPFAISPELAFDYWSSSYWKVGALTLALAWIPRTARDIELVTKVLIVGGILVGIVAVYNKVSGIGLVEGSRVTVSNEGGWGSMLGDPNDLALILLIPLSFSFSVVVYQTGLIHRLLGVAGLFTIGWAIIGTQSRGGFLGVLVVLLIVAMRHIRSKMLLGVIGFVLAVAFYSAMEISDRVPEAGIVTDEAALGRLYAWQAGFNMAVARPLTGVGFNNFVSEFLSFAPIRIPRGFTAHSIWFLVLGETGFPGLLVFIALILRCFSASHRNLKALASAQAPPVLQSTARALLAGLAGFCVSGSFLSHAYTWPLYVLAGLVSALSQYCATIEPARSSGSSGP